MTEKEKGLFFSKIAATADPERCWLWLAATNAAGYGRFRVSPSMELAHRVSWEVFKGPIPDGMNVCHDCDTPACVNPDHLFLGTQADNLADMTRKGRRRGGGGAGIKNGRAKLTERDVLDIRLSEETCVALGRRYGVNHVAISRVRRRESWTHI